MLYRQEVFFKEAEKQLQLAKEEIYKPKEDMVVSCVCKNTQRAVENYLKGYLIKEKIEIEKKDTLEKLFNKCLQLNTKLREISIESFSNTEKKTVLKCCSESEEACACFDTANALDTFFRKNNII